MPTPDVVVNFKDYFQRKKLPGLVQYLLGLSESNLGVLVAGADLL